MKVYPMWAKLVALGLGCFLAGRLTVADDNSAPKYGDESGAPSNCRALVAAGVEGAQRGIYSPTESLASIDRNCGLHGQLWKQ